MRPTSDLEGESDIFPLRTWRTKVRSTSDLEEEITSDLEDESGITQGESGIPRTKFEIQFEAGGRNMHPIRTWRTKVRFPRTKVGSTSDLEGESEILQGESEDRPGRK